MMFDYLGYLLLVVVVVMFLAMAIRILREYERGIIFTLGRFTGVKGPGLIILIPFAQQMVKVDLRVVVQDVPPQDVITRDNVTVKVNAVLYFRIVDPERAIIKVADFMTATSQLAQTTLRSVLGKHELDELLAERDRLNADIQEILDQQTDAWGIKVTNVEIKHVDLNESMIRAIAKQAEAERLRRAKVINAEGEQQAAEKLVEAGRLRPVSRRRCSYAISPPSTTSRASGPQPSSFRCRQIYSPSRPATGRGEVTLIRSDFDHRWEWRTGQNKRANAYTVEISYDNFSGSRVELLSPMTICTFGKIATRHRPGNQREIMRGHRGSWIHVLQAGLDLVRDEFRCHATKEFSLD